MLVILFLLSTFYVVPPADAGVACRLDPPTCSLTARPSAGTITLDGHLDEDDWKGAPVATGFRQFEPREGAPASQRTEVRVLYGSDALFIGATLYDENPRAIKATLGRRDEFNQADWFIASIDSYFDRKTAYTFAVNAAGVQVDGILTNDLDRSWDAVWESAVQITPEGWIVEMRIPFSMLRFTDSDIQQWGINFRRIIPRLSETDEWALVPRSERGTGPVAQFGTLQGLRHLRPRRNVQVTPYTLTRLQTEEGDAGGLHREAGLDVGGDLKIGLSSNVTLDATVNPDFGQVESDPAVLNLTAFEIFFPEKRPFFVEGLQIFDFELERQGQLLYTRRIGGTYPLIGAAKLSGRSSRGLSFGLLGASSGENFDPTRLYGVGRLLQEVGQHSSIGGMFTGFETRESTEVRRSLAGGFDWDLRLDDNTYRIGGQVSGTYRVRPEEDIASERGFSLKLDLDKIRGDWNVFSGVTVISDDYNPNDVGRLLRNDYMNIGGGFSYQVNGGEPFGPFQRASIRLFSGNGWSYRDRLDLGLGFFFFSNWETRGFQRIGLNVRSDYWLGGYDMHETRGLGPSRKPFEITFGTEYETDSRRSWQLEPGFEIGFIADGGRRTSFEFEAEWNASPRLTLSAKAAHGREDDFVAWVSNESFARTTEGWAIGLESESPGNLGTGEYRNFDDDGMLDGIMAFVEPYDDLGHYYLPIFGARDTRSLDLTLRSDVTFTPTLSLQLYGQLFVARGRYDDYALLRDRDTLVPFAPYPKRHDFALSSVQANTVLRWEYRPGSTLYVVWSQARTGDAVFDPFDHTSSSPYAQPTTDQFTDAFELFPTNVFLLKLSYTFLR